MDRQWQLQEAKAKFSELVARAQQGEVHIITKHGEPVAVLQSYENYEKSRPHKAMSAWEALRGDQEVNAFDGMSDAEIDDLLARPQGTMRPIEL
jgi:prevent-host-death family protein